jgi:hypothetical protein
VFKNVEKYGGAREAALHIYISLYDILVTKEKAISANLLTLCVNLVNYFGLE